MNAPQIVITPAERRQVARVIEFSRDIVLYVDWNRIAETARDLGAHFDCRTSPDGSMTVTLFWTYSPEEAGLVIGDVGGRSGRTSRSPVDCPLSEE